MAHHWPGNVRELENCIEHAIALRSGNTIQLADLPPVLQAVAATASGPTGGVTQLQDLERATIERVFAEVHGDKHQALKMLGISRATLYRKLKRYNIPQHPRNMAN